MNLRRKIIATSLSVAMLFSVMTPVSASATNEAVVNNKKPVATEKSEAKKTVNESTVSRIEKSASQPSKAGKLINQIDDTATYEESLRTLLDNYYINGNYENAEKLDNVVDSRGDKIFKNYSNAQQERKTEPEELGFMPGEVLVVTKTGLSDEEIPDIINDERMSVVQIVPYTEGRKLVKIAISLEDTVDNAIKKLESNKNIESIEKDQIYTIDYSLGDYVDDVKYEDLYHMNLVNSVEAWKLIGKTDHEKIKVAVIDTGADVNHEDLKDVINRDLSVRITADGIICPLKNDSGMHGTHVGGIIAAEANNGVGIAGVGSAIDNSAIDLISIGCDIGNGSSFNTMCIYKAIKYAVESGARVINMSLGGQGDPDNIFQNSVSLAVNSGCVVVCAAGNDMSREYYYPSDCNGAISVISLDSTGEERAYFSNYGASKNKISAPGAPVCSTIPDNKYEYFEGTSMASPVVAAVAGMVLSVNPELTAEEAKNIIFNSADDINGGGYDDDLGYGRVNAYEAVKQAIEYKNEATPTSLKLSNSKLELVKGATTKLSGKVYPENAVQTISYHSKNDGVATITADGTITAKSSGTTEIVACTANSIITSCTVTVKDNASSKLSKPVTETIQTGISTGANIKWNKVDNAEYYQIFASVEKDGDYSYIGSTYHTTYAIDMINLYALPASTVYYLKIKAVTTDNSISDSEFSDTIAYVYVGQEPYLTAELIREEGYGNGIFLHWGAIVSSELYRTCVDTNETVLLKTFNAGIDDNWYYDNKNELEVGKTYTYTLKLFNVYNGEKYYGVENNITFEYQLDDPVTEGFIDPHINEISYRDNMVYLSMLKDPDHFFGSVYASSDNGKSWFLLFYMLNSGEGYNESALDTLKLKPGRKYLFRYKFHENGDTSGIYNNCSKYSNIVSITVPRDLITPELVVNSDDNNNALLSWYGPEAEDGYYTVYRRCEGSADWEKLEEYICRRNFVDTTVEDGKIYFYKVAFTDSTAEVAFDVDDTVTTWAGSHKYSDSNIVSHRTSKVVKDICAAEFSKIDDVVYSDSIDLPALTVTYKGKKLKKNTDYVLYSNNNDKVGRASITVIGIGEYTGEKVIYYNILEPEENKPVTHTVTYKDYDGSVISTQKVVTNANAEQPNPPKRTGYIFMGWNDNGDNITADKTITATYKKSEDKIYTVTFIDRENNVISIEKVEFGGNAKAPTPPVFDGYEFVEWNNDFTNITNNILVKAKYKATRFESGTGTESNPYTISTPEQLDYFSYVINFKNSEYGSACYQLANNIYYNNISDYAYWGQSDITGDMYRPENIWEPAGIKYEDGTQYCFSGTFDGKGHSIFGLFLSDMTRDYVGFIGYANNAVIRNLGIENSYFETRGNYAGALVGMFSSVATRAEINCCFARENYIIANSYVGGLIGEAISINTTAETKITNCYSSGGIVESPSGNFVGGLAGLFQVNGSYTLIQRCYAYNEVSTPADEPIAGSFSGDIRKADNAGIISFWGCYCTAYSRHTAYYGKYNGGLSYSDGVDVRAILDYQFMDRNTFPEYIEYTTDENAMVDLDAVWVFSTDDLPRLYIEGGKYTAEFYLDDELFYFVALDEGEKLNVPYVYTDYGYTATGWSIEIPETMPANNLTVYNTTKKHTYKVEFYLNDQIFETQTYNEGDVIVPPTNNVEKLIEWTDLPPVMPEQNLKVYGHYKNSMLGDVNGDKEVSVTDVILVMRQTIEPTTLNAEQISVADVDYNGIVDIVDAIIIQRFVIGMITKF